MDKPFILPIRMYAGSFFRYERLKPKYGVSLQGFPVAMVTCYVMKMAASYSAIIDVSLGTIAAVK